MMPWDARERRRVRLRVVTEAKLVAAERLPEMTGQYGDDGYH
jgi:hypothetical protein